MQSLFTHHQVVFKLYEFLSSAEHERRFFFKNVGDQTVDGPH